MGLITSRQKKPTIMDNHSLASSFTRYSLQIQQSLCEKLKDLTNKVYVFDGNGYFHTATTHVLDGIRYKYYDDHYAVLSVAAQCCFHNSNEYLQFSDNVRLNTDNIGVYLLI